MPRGCGVCGNPSCAERACGATLRAAALSHHLDLAQDATRVSGWAAVEAVAVAEEEVAEEEAAEEEAAEEEAAEEEAAEEEAVEVVEEEVEEGAPSRRASRLARP